VRLKSSEFYTTASGEKRTPGYTKRSFFTLAKPQNISPDLPVMFVVVDQKTGSLEPVQVFFAQGGKSSALSDALLSSYRGGLSSGSNLSAMKVRIDKLVTLQEIKGHLERALEEVAREMKKLGV